MKREILLEFIAIVGSALAVAGILAVFLHKVSEGGYMDSMPRYRCHKEVRALKISRVLAHDPPPGVIFAGGFIFSEEPGLGPIEISADYLQKHDPKPGGYYVLYEDGYASFSPAAAFESGYDRIEEPN